MPHAETQVPPLLPSIAGPTPARLVRRALAMALDTVLASVAAMLILTAIVYPQNYPNWQETVLVEGRASMEQFRQSLAAGQVAPVKVSEDYMNWASTTMSTLFLVLLGYFVLSEMFSGGATLGKRVFGLRAARCGSAEPPLFIESLSRCIFKATSLVWPPLLIANIVPVFFHPTRRAGHDYLARTIVTGAPPPAPVERAADEDHF